MHRNLFWICFIVAVGFSFSPVTMVAQDHSFATKTYDLSGIFVRDDFSEDNRLRIEWSEGGDYGDYDRSKDGLGIVDIEPMIETRQAALEGLMIDLLGLEDFGVLENGHYFSLVWDRGGSVRITADETTHSTIKSFFDFLNQTVVRDRVNARISIWKAESSFVSEHWEEWGDGSDLQTLLLEGQATGAVSIVAELNQTSPTSKVRAVAVQRESYVYDYDVQVADNSRAFDPITEFITQGAEAKLTVLPLREIPDAMYLRGTITVAQTLEMRRITVFKSSSESIKLDLPLRCMHRITVSRMIPSRQETLLHIGPWQGKEGTSLIVSARCSAGTVVEDDSRIWKKNQDRAVAIWSMEEFVRLVTLDARNTNDIEYEIEESIEDMANGFVYRRCETAGMDLDDVILEKVGPYLVVVGEPSGLETVVADIQKQILTRPQIAMMEWQVVEAHSAEDINALSAIGRKVEAGIEPLQAVTESDLSVVRYVHPVERGQQQIIINANLMRHVYNYDVQVASGIAVHDPVIGVSVQSGMRAVMQWEESSNHDEDPLYLDVERVTSDPLVTTVLTANGYEVPIEKPRSCKVSLQGHHRLHRERWTWIPMNGISLSSIRPYGYGILIRLREDK